MLFKLALSGLRSRFKDYLVLFSGLIVTSAIFYMFLSLSTNPEFLNQNPTVKSIGTLFVIGDVLLGIITLVYVIYANSFLLSMRQRDYGLFMMLGAKSSKIGNLIFVETLFLGILATLVGSVIGVFATQGVAGLLVNNLGLSINGFIGFHLPAVLWTVLFFSVLFFLAALFNRVKISTISVLNLLKDNEKPVKYRRNVWLTLGQAVIGIGALVVAYYAMINNNQLGINGFWAALIGVIVGTYFVFNAFFPVFIDMLRKWKWFNNRKLNNFTLNQLKFRITSYTRILSVVSVLFAMAIGAITVALMMRETAFESADNSAYYDVAVYQDKPEIKSEVSKLKIADQTTFHYKVVDNKVIGLKSELDTQNISSKDFDNELSIKNQKPTYSLKTTSGDNNKDYLTNMFMSAYNENLTDKSKSLSAEYTNETGPMANVAQFVSQSEFDQADVPAQEIQLIKTTDFRQDLLTLQQINTLQNPNSTDIGTLNYLSVNSQKINAYQSVNNLLSIFQFIGLFLGVAFLTMLASILIFKILSGAHQDTNRYKMLDKIGARQSVMTRSIAQELGVLFILPGAMGIMHMLFGLNLFKSMVSNIYSRVWFPMIIFLVLYFLYYLLTLFIYRSIVLPKRKK